ncbi:MAG: biopolymer transporter ExbD [Elusimicrobia bacterium]|nr:biopolymer transporter ExbD [Elusimicrobiota bacterium]
MENEKESKKSDDLSLESESKVAVWAHSPQRAHRTETALDEEPITEINVTPLVDVALVLVIIFMAVSPFMLQASLQVTESRAGAATGKSSLEENVQVLLTEENKIFVNGSEVAVENFFSVLKESLEKSKDGLLSLQAGKKNRVGQVVELLDLAKQAGAKKVAILNKGDSN